MDKERAKRFIQAVRPHLLAWDPACELPAEDDHKPDEDIYDAAIPVLRSLVGSTEPGVRNPTHFIGFRRPGVSCSGISVGKLS